MTELSRIFRAKPTKAWKENKKAIPNCLVSSDIIPNRKDKKEDHVQKQ